MPARKQPTPPATVRYAGLVGGIGGLLEAARRASARSVNALMTATYWEIGRRIVEFEQAGEKRAEYGEALLKRLAQDLTVRLGRGFSRQNLQNMRLFYLAAPADRIRQTVSGKLADPKIRQTTSGMSETPSRILQTSSALSPALPFSLADLEDALVRHLETFLLELGNDFAFVGRQRRLRIDDEWYLVDLLFFHRRLRCLVIIDLKLGRFTHADAGQMHLYLNYAREHWVQPDENPPVGVMLCSSKGEALVRYATEALPNKLLVREYLTALPDEKVLSRELEKTRRKLESRHPSSGSAR